MNVRELQKIRATVLGAARSGIAVAKLLRSAGSTVFVSDQGEPASLNEAAAEFSSHGIDFEAGGHSERVFDCALMVLSPGVPSESPAVREAMRRNIRIVSELEVASWFSTSPIVAVTGSNGKTTTTTLIGRILGDAKKKHVVAGNIGTAFSSVVLGMAPEEIAVLEVSSFQLDHCETFRPNIAIILNITRDHMDRYGNSMDRYAASKSRLFMNQGEADTIVYCADDPWTARVAQSARSRKLAVSAIAPQADGAWMEEGLMKLQVGGKVIDIISTEQMTVRGIHNAYNAMAASLAGYLSGVGPASIRATLRNFKGVEHRMEFVREHAGVRYYNDSKATNVDAVRYAIQAFTSPVILILGGRDKGNNYGELKELVRKHVKSIIAIGESASKVRENFESVVTTRSASTMDEAVSLAVTMAQHGDVVLLSPACASFDWFRNYEHRGEVFKHLVNTLGNPGRT